MRRDPTPDQRADELASRQYAAINRRQALRCGLTVEEIRGRLSSGRWTSPIRSVYRVTGAPVTWHQHAMVAVLGGPPGTVVSHLTAAAVLGLCPAPPVPHVTVPRNASARLANAIVHRSPLDPSDIWVVRAIPSTRPARTLVDVASVMAASEIIELVDDALCRRLTEAAAIRTAIERATARPGRKGIGLLEVALAVWTPGPLPGSPAEMRLIRRLVAWRFPMPERQIEVRDGRGQLAGIIDIGWRDQKVGIEYDGERHHLERHWAHDDRREDALAALGWTIIRADRFDLRPSTTRLRDVLAARLGVPRAS